MLEFLDLCYKKQLQSFKKKLNVENFIVSKYCLKSFKKRPNISQKTLWLEPHDVNVQTVDSFKRRSSDLLENCKKEDIFNDDEYSLFYAKQNIINCWR